MDNRCIICVRLQPRLLLLVGLHCSASSARVHANHTRTNCRTDSDTYLAPNARTDSEANAGAYSCADGCTDQCTDG